MSQRIISGRRADVTGIRAPEKLIGVSIEGRGVRSLAGIERMVNLRSLELEMLHSPDLSLLGRLPRLEQLSLEWCAGDIDFRPIADLSGLRRLYVRSDESAAAAAMGKVEL